MDTGFWIAHNAILPPIWQIRAANFGSRLVFAETTLPLVWLSHRRLSKSRGASQPAQTCQPTKDAITHAKTQTALD